MLDLVWRGAAPGCRIRARGFSLLELVIVIVIISVLITMAIGRLLALAVDAERVAMETVVGSLRSAIGIKVAEHIARQDIAGLARLVGTNPMDRLAEVPGNYLGERDGADPITLEDGHWYFDRRSRALVYLVRHREYFAGGVSEPPRARFSVQVVYTEVNGNGVFDPGVERIEGLRLAPLEPYRWIR
jgi:general secretion pathway protein G